MKLPKIATVLKKRKIIVLNDQADENGEITQQYIGNGMCLYPLEGMPIMTPEEILNIIGVTSGEQDKWVIRHQMIPDNLMKDFYPTDVEAKQSGLGIIWRGHACKQLISENSETVFVEGAYIAPLIDEKVTMDYYIRCYSGVNCVAIKAGMFLRAVLFPCNILSDELVGSLESVARRCRAELPKQAELQGALTEITI